MRSRHEDKPLEAFATSLQRGLEEEHCSQKELAKRLGLHPATVSLWLSGEQTPREDDETTIAGLAEFLRTSAEQVKELIRASKERIRSSQVRVQPPQTLDNLFQFLADIPRGPGARTAKTPTPNIPVVGDALMTTFPWESNQEVRVREFVQIACRTLDEQFARSADRALRDSEFAAAIKDMLSEETSHTQTCLTTALRSELLRLKLIEEYPVGTLKQRYPIDPGYVATSLFGLRTHIRNLDWVLDGGVAFPTGDTGRIALVKGKPGTGKTMLALQLAASFATAGHLVIYLTVEQETDLLLGKLKFAGYDESREDHLCIMTRDESRFALVQDLLEMPTSDELAKVLRAEDRSPGLMVITSIPGVKALNRMRSEFGALLDRSTSESKRRMFYTCFFIDSIDALLNTHQRKVYRELLDFVGKKSQFGLFISETSGERPDLIVRDYLVDMVFRLDYRIEAEGVKSRVLEIEKCRTQSVRLGEHLFEITHGQGFVVKPSIASLLSVWRRRTRRHSQLEAESWTLAKREEDKKEEEDKELDLSLMLAGDVVNGSAILLSGPPATHKLALGLTFLAAGIVQEKANHTSGPRKECCLLVSLREDQRSLARIIRTYDQLSPLLVNEKDSSCINPCLEILYDPPSYQTPEGFMDWIREALANLCASGKRVSRVLFNSLSQLRHNSPICEREPLLVAALIELFKKEGITSLFIDVDMDRKSEIQQVFDTIIFTERNDSDPSAEVRLMVGHSIPGNADRAIHRLERFTKGPIQRLKLTRDYYSKAPA